MSRWLVALALLGGLRVLLGAVALPFFSPVDEAAHWDLLGKYARGAWPTRGADSFDPEVIESLARASPEFLMPRSWGAAPPPAWNAASAGPLGIPLEADAYGPEALLDTPAGSSLTARTERRETLQEARARFDL